LVDEGIQQVRGVAAARAFDVVHVDGAAFAGGHRVLGEEELVDGVGVQVHREIVPVGSDQRAIDDGGGGTPVLVDLDRGGAGRHGFFHRFGVGAAAAEQGVVDRRAFHALQQKTEHAGGA